MEGGQREHLRELANGLKVRVLVHVDDHLSYMNAADLVVTMAGYNTLYQLLRLRKKGLVIPRSGPSAEQQTRARDRKSTRLNSSHRYTSDAVLCLKKNLHPRELLWFRSPA